MKKAPFKRTSDKKTADKPKAKPKSKANRGAWVTRPPKGQFEPDPKDKNTVDAIRAKLQEIREYKRILAQDGLKPDEADKQRESDLIKQLIRIEKGLPPTKPSEKTKKKLKKKKAATAARAERDKTAKEAAKQPQRRSR